MPYFSDTSKRRLATCHKDLQILFEEVVVRYDCIVIEGHRGKTRQDKAFNEGKSKLKYPDGNHNAVPSLAVDVAPYVGRARGKIDWKDSAQFNHFAGFVQGLAERLLNEGHIKHRIRWGGDWRMTYTNLKANKFKDLVHFELRKPTK